MSSPLTSEKKTIKIVMAGPMPPAVGGMATVLDDLQHSSLKDQVLLEMFNTAKQTPEGRSLKQAVGARFKLWKRWCCLLSSKKSIAHIHTCSGLTFFLDCSFLVLAKIKRVPVVLHVHGARFDQFLDDLPLFLKLLARFFAACTDKVVVLSPEWESKLAKRLPGAHFYVIANGVATPKTVPYQRVTEKITILFLGNLSRRKGIQDLISAMQFIDAKCQLIVAGGEDDPGITNSVRDQICSLDLERRVQLLGAVTGDAKGHCLNIADLFVLPSYAEGVPISMLEAMAAGLAVIVTPVGGIPSVIKHLYNGVLVEPGNVSELAEAIQMLIDNPAQRSNIAQQGKHDCLEQYGVENSVNSYVKLYQELSD